MAPFAKHDRPPTREEQRCHAEQEEHLDPRELAAVFVGGAAGALLRVLLDRGFGGGAPSWPWATFAINVSGSLALAYVATRLPSPGLRRRLLGTGFCGAYTTFSIVQLEAITIVDHHRYALAAGHLVASLVAGYVAICAGTALARRTKALA
ncbi:MAG: CrcB family protein [Solirubrobacteraceae bacterium]